MMWQLNQYMGESGIHSGVTTQVSGNCLENFVDTQDLINYTTE